MNLTRLEIFGFKSFAQKATFKFNTGLTGIIGPNGCGKSNVVDAIRWVLGEQRPSVLRSDRMENVIFNGTATRKPLGLSEVSLYIENNRNILPSEYSEIKITRRLYRSGESEYLINNQVVRLMDITNLFADTGMGADAYSVIELKMVEQILSDNAQERRRLFEEAAGIKKYKARRRSALNKLETTEQELTRLDDILSEVRKAVNSLARQVGKARRYHEYKAGLRENELLLFHLKISDAQNQLLPMQSEISQVKHSRDSMSREIHKLEADLEARQAASVDTENAYRRKSAVLHRKDEAIQERQNRRQLRKQRISSLQEAIAGYEQEVERRHGRIDQLTADRERFSKDLERLRAEMTASQEHYRNSANAQLEAETVFQKARDTYQTFVQTNVRELRDVGSARENLQRIRVEQESIDKTIEKQQAALGQLKAEHRRLEEAHARSTTALAAQKADLDLYRRESENLEAQLSETRNDLDTLKNDINVAEGRLEKLRSRKDFLDNLINSYEGFSESVQYIMSRKHQYNGVVDTLANLVDCPEIHRPALESYLAGVSNYLIVEAMDTARDILHHLRDENKGRLTLVPLSILRNGRPPVAMPNGEGNDGVALREVVTFPDDYRPLFEFLFQSVYLVPDLETAMQLRAGYPEVTFVTRDGEIMEHWGNVTGGGESHQVGLIGRKEQFEKVCRQLDELQAGLAGKQEALTHARERLAEQEGKQREFRELQAETEKQVIALEKRQTQEEYEAGRLAQSAEAAELEIGALRERLVTLGEQEKKLAPELQSFEENLAAYQEREQVMLAEQKTAEERLKDISRVTQQHQISYLNLTSQEKEFTQKLNFIRESLEEAERFIGERRQKIEQNRAEIAKLEAEIDAVETELETLYRERDEAEKDRNETEKRFQDMRTGIQAAEADLKKRQRLWNQARERVQELELRVRELEVKVNAQKEQISERYGEDALDFDVRKAAPATTLADVQRTIEDLRRKLETLGDVNPLAIKEHEKEKERLDFLNAQRDDLLSAREQLVETIDKLNRTARKQFMEVFAKIRHNFQRVFQEFFQGGKAELQLVESRDPLEANIDIAVTHKGKRLNTLSLLSAGEKTLTAISLLFAIYLVKPSPFCILDEVDAPLDDINIGRFTQALNLFSRDTQFILVTHNKKTMEATNSIYGVTMEEPGVSKVVSVRFD